MPGKRGTPYERWLRFVNKTDTCWLWTGATYRKGYGHFGMRVDGKWVMYKAHRFSYEQHVGTIPAGHLVRHTCDTPACVNPSHLLTGTVQDNTDDRVQRGRHRYGIRTEHRAVTQEEVNRIQSGILKGLRQCDLASETGLSRQQVSRICRREIHAGGVL